MALCCLVNRYQRVERVEETYGLYLLEGVSKQVTNGSKTAVMDVIGFLCVSLGSSTVQLRDSLGSRRACACSETGFSSQNSDHAWGTYYRRAASCCAFFLLTNLFDAKDIHKKCFLFMVEALRRTDPPSKEFYQLCIGLQKWKSGHGPTHGCRAIAEWMNELRFPLPIMIPPTVSCPLTNIDSIQSWYWHRR
jgi:hypothetical protein